MALHPFKIRQSRVPFPRSGTEGRTGISLGREDETSGHVAFSVRNRYAVVTVNGVAGNPVGLCYSNMAGIRSGVPESVAFTPPPQKIKIVKKKHRVVTAAGYCCTKETC